MKLHKVYRIQLTHFKKGKYYQFHLVVFAIWLLCLFDIRKKLIMFS